MLTSYGHNYGYGWVIDTLFGHVHTYHGGFLDGFNCTFERWPEDRLCIAVFSNDDEAPVKKMARGLAAIVYNQSYDYPIKKTAIHLDGSVLSDYEGIYEINDTLFRVISSEDNCLFVQTGMEPREKLLPQALDTFFFSKDNTKTITFIRDSSNAITGQILYDDGFYYQADKVSDALKKKLQPLKPVIELDDSLYARYTGLYELLSRFGEEEFLISLTIIQLGKRLIASSEGIGQVEIFPESETVFSHKESDFSIKFLLDQLNNVTGCLVTMGNAEIRGVKVH
jgi:hypothetical protein